MRPVHDEPLDLAIDRVIGAMVDARGAAAPTERSWPARDDRRWSWAFARPALAAAVMLVAAGSAIWMTRPAPVDAPDWLAARPSAPAVTPHAAAVVPDTPDIALPASRMTTSTPAPERRPAHVVLSPVADDAVAPIALEALDVSAIEVPGITLETYAIDALTLPPLVVEAPGFEEEE